MTSAKSRDRPRPTFLLPRSAHDIQDRPDAIAKILSFALTASLSVSGRHQRLLVKLVNEALKQPHQTGGWTSSRTNASLNAAPSASASTATHATSTAGIKRGREEDGEALWRAEAPSGKRSRPTLAGHDSVINTPTQASSQHPKYDSDDQSSMMSEPGSPQEMISSGDDDMEMDDVATYSQSPEEYQHLPRAPQPVGPWARRVQNRSGHRVATPFAHANAGRTSANAITIRTGFKQHVRDRHPQEIASSDGHLEVPSPIDEDEVPTPPSAADVAGSQLSTLSVNDMEIETADALPSITIAPARSSYIDGTSGSRAVSMEPEAEGLGNGFLLRKQRQRSGAQSNGSVSPIRLSAAHREDGDGGMAKRGLSIGYRADCDKCRMKVPGHMNHFVS